MKRVILFGAGAMTRRLFQIYSDSEEQFNIKGYVIAIADNNNCKWSNNYCNSGISVISPVLIKNYSYDMVIICARGKAAETIRRQLLEELSVTEDKIDYLDKYLTLPSDKIERSRLYNDRRSILKEYEKNQCVAEVGVAFGNFSECIIKNMNPKKFYAIDYFFANNPYLAGCSGMWDSAAFRTSGLTLKEFYEQKFEEEINNDILEIRQGFSWEVLETFDDQYFDFVYLDAAHDYESVKKDINVLCRKVKKGGIIQFNDYGFVHAVTKVAYGVLPAVNHFVWNNKCEVIGYCINENGFADIAVRLL